LNNGTADEPKLVNVGISYINLNDSTKPTREVYFMIDLIDGEVNGGNMSSIYCPYIGDYLGNQLTSLLTDARNSTKNKWAVDKNRQMFSLKMVDASITNNFSRLQLDSKPSERNGPLQLENSKSNQTDTSESLKPNFMSRILTNPTEIQTLLDELKTKYPRSNDILSFDAVNILKNLKTMKSNRFAQELYDAIEIWNKNMDKQNPELIKKLINIQSSISGQTEIINREKISYATKNDTTGQTKLLLDKENDVNKIINNIVTMVLNHESKSKRERIAGGTKKHTSALVVKNKYSRKKH
jgi:hypothetical protein